ncbi:hypothetical protein B2G71_04585 [Novosphingobium sp. PC22D]|nr:hypothetical protein B2G71_04585 [Novosphingobium sp. PC22D]
MATLGIFSGAANAADAPASGWDFEASTRVRYEAYDGGYRPGGRESEDAVSIRTSLGVTYDGDGFGAGLEIRDSRAYSIDETTPLGSGDIDALEVAQAWVAADVAEGARLTAGRFLLNIGSKRLAGDPAYRNAANAFTGLRFDWQGQGDSPTALTAFFTLPDDRLPNDKPALARNKFKFDRERWDLRFWGAHVARKIGTIDGELYVIGLDENDYPGKATRNRHLVTVGSRLRRSFKSGISAELEGMVQRGNIRESKAADAPEVPVRAWSMHADLAYRLGGSLKPRITVFGDIASGDKAGTRKYERFDSLYGPRRGDWGPTSLFGPLGRSNIKGAGIRFDIAPSKRFDVFGEWRRVGLVSASDAFSFTRVIDPEGNSGRDGGSQFQARARYWLVPKRMQLETGAAYLDKGRFLKTAPNAPRTGDTKYGYASALYTF